MNTVLVVSPSRFQTPNATPGTTSGENSVTAPAELIAAADDLSEVFDSLRQVHATIPALETLEEMACGQQPQPLLIAWNHLLLAVDAPDTVQRDPRDASYLRYTNAPFLRSQSGYTIAPEFGEPRWDESLEDALDTAAFFEQVTHVRLLRIFHVQEPALQDDVFVPGRVVAWLVTFEWASGQPVCAQRVEASNSEEVWYGGALSDWTSASTALQQDLWEQFRGRLAQADPLYVVN